MAGRIRPVVIVGDPVLHRPAVRVTEFNPDLEQLIEDMFATMYVANGVGLAAPQIGVGLAVFVYDCPDADEVAHKGHLINPVIALASPDRSDDEEGCLSVPGPYAPVSRPDQVTLRGLTSSGAPTEVTGTGLFARCLIHETEHLDGVLYIDHLNRRRRSRVLQAVAPFEWNAEPAG